MLFSASGEFVLCSSYFNALRGNFYELRPICTKNEKRAGCTILAVYTDKKWANRQVWKLRLHHTF